MIKGAEHLRQIHKNVLEQVGIDQGQFSTDFNERLSLRQIWPHQVRDFREYYNEIAIKDGYLGTLFDWYRRNVDPRLEQPITRSYKAGLI